MTGIRISKRLLVVTIAVSVFILLAFLYTHRTAAEYFRKTNLHIADSSAAPVTTPEDQGNVVFWQGVLWRCLAPIPVTEEASFSATL